MIWLLYLILLVSSIVDWVTSYNKAESSTEIFTVITSSIERSNSIATVALHSRTLDLITTKNESNPFFGSTFYEDIHSKLVIAVNRLSNAQNFLLSHPELFIDTLLESERSLIPLQKKRPSNKSWSLTLNFAIQKYVKYALILTKYNTSLKELTDNYDEVMFYLITDYRTLLLGRLEHINHLYEEDTFYKLSRARLIIIIVIIISMVFAIICYILIIPRILDVARHELSAMEIFSEIPSKDIADMVSTIRKISIEHVVFDRKVVDNSESLGNQYLTNEKYPVAAIKSTESLVNATVKTLLAPETAEDPMVKEPVKVMEKQKLLTKVDQGEKRKAVLIITGFIIAVLSYYGGTILITHIIFTNYKDLAINLRYVNLRYVTLSLLSFVIRELAIINNGTLKNMADGFLDRVYDLERSIQSFKNTKSAIYNNFKDLALRLDSESFCDTISNKLSSKHSNDCKDFMQGTMMRGMQNNIYQVMSYYNAIMNLFSQYKDDDDVYLILKQSNWDAASNLLHNI